MSKIPLAERMRPKHLSDLVGQDHLIGNNGLLTNIIKNQKKIPSIIFWGPPGVGKTSLAQLIASTTNLRLHSISAINSGVKDIRSVTDNHTLYKPDLLFIDEIHRFNKAQQDALLHVVETGVITLIGATTENPSFEVNSALLSRCLVYVLNPLSEKEITQILMNAISNDVVLSKEKIEIEDTAIFYRYCGGDSRKSLNLLELILSTYPDRPLTITPKLVKEVAYKSSEYDKVGEKHYDVISAFIKSVRGGDPNAALYWLAYMLNAGEDILFIARRLIILASEDIGNAQPNALVLATSGFQAIERIGMPEARIILAQMTTYIACCPKSNASYQGIEKALKATRETPLSEVPLHLRNAPTQLMKDLNYGKHYKYSHDYDELEANQQFMPKELESIIFYHPKNIGKEKELKQYLKNKWKDYYSYDEE